MVATSLDEGIAHIASSPPSLMLVQSRLSGLSADIIIRHLKSELGKHPCMVVLLAEGSGSSAAADLVLDTGADDDDLVAAMRGAVADAAAGPARPHDASGAKKRKPKNPQAPTDQPLFVPDSSAKVDSAPEPPDVTLAAPPSAGPPAAAADTTVPHGDEEPDGGPATPAPVAGDPGPETAQEPPAATFQEELDSLLGPPQAASPPSPPVAEEQNLVGPTVDEYLKISAPARRTPRTSTVVALVLVAGAALYLVASWMTGPKQDPAHRIPAAAPKAAVAPTPQPAPPSTPPAANSAAPSPAPGSAAPSPLAAPTLFSFIPAESKVKGHEATNPGWEKYLTPEIEFRINREKGAIKALQAIDRTGKGIPRKRFTLMIQEVAGVRDYRLESKEKKGDLLVKRGKLTARSKLVLYKRNDDTHLQAFVIYFL